MINFQLYFYGKTLYDQTILLLWR